MGKRTIVLLVILAGLLAWFYFFVYGTPAAFHQYKVFMNEMFKLQYDKAATRVLPSGKSAFEAAKLFYTSNYTRFREGFGYPKYVIVQEERAPDGQTITYLIHQTVKADPPGATSTFGTMLLAYKHLVIMQRDGISWKVARFQFAKTDLAKTRIEKKVINHESPGAATAEISRISDMVKEIMDKFQGNKKHVSEDAAPKISLSRKPGEGETRFKLVSGESVTGKVVFEDDVYYTLEQPDGSQTIVIKEDIAA